ncbi:hypothetical protein A2U01_0070147, partial [Trifolium medium]|nr:hypothetical protein [Trifolium medium]
MHSSNSATEVSFVLQEIMTEEAKYAGNYKKPNPYSYNSGWRDNPNPKWNQNAALGNQQTQQPRKP